MVAGMIVDQNGYLWLEVRVFPYENRCGMNARELCACVFVYNATCGKEDIIFPSVAAVSRQSSCV